jgi:hypothetical protein
MMGMTVRSRKLSRHQDAENFEVPTERGIDQVRENGFFPSIPKEYPGGQTVNDQTEDSSVGWAYVGVEGLRRLLRYQHAACTKVTHFVRIA